MPADSAPIPCPFEKRFPSQLVRDDTFFMSLAFNQAIDAWRQDEVPIGAVIEVGGEVIGAAHNTVESARDPTAHAEILALREAAAAIGNYRLENATLYATLEPCVMCAGALVAARVLALRRVEVHPVFDSLDRELTRVRCPALVLLRLQVGLDLVFVHRVLLE
mgnify:CR=1 FL=1